MAYLGTKPQSGFISQEANQYFTGLTQNYIDLNQSISSLSSVIILVNGVVQENSDLTLTSTSRITLGATLVASDKVTCIYVAKISSTQAPATGSVTSDMLSGSIANSKLANSSITLNGSAVSLGGSLTGIGEANTPAFDVQGTDSQSVSNNAYAKVTFNSELKDTDSAFDLSNERFTVPSGKGGLYTFHYSCQNSQKASANVVYQIVLYKNGSLAEGTLVRQNPTTTGNYDVFLNGSASLVLSASDYVEVYYYQNTGGSVNLESNKRKFSGFRVTT